MTIAELERAIESKRRVKNIEAQEKASFDYILAELVGKSIARIFNSNNTMPDITEVYPSLFESNELKEQKIAKQAELSALRFKLFANSYNSRFKGGGKEN